MAKQAGAHNVQSRNMSDMLRLYMFRFLCDWVCNFYSFLSHGNHPDAAQLRVYPGLALIWSSPIEEEEEEQEEEEEEEGKNIIGLSFSKKPFIPGDTTIGL